MKENDRYIDPNFKAGNGMLNPIPENPFNPTNSGFQVENPINPTIERPFFDGPVSKTKLSGALNMSISTLTQLVNGSGLEVRHEGRLISADSANEISSRFSGMGGKRGGNSSWVGLDSQINTVKVSAQEVQEMAKVDSVTLFGIVSVISQRENYIVKPDRKGNYSEDDAQLICGYIDDLRRGIVRKELGRISDLQDEAAG